MASNSGQLAQSLILTDQSKVAVVGGGPAGSFFSYFCLDLAKRSGLSIAVDLYDSKDFTVSGPPGCNHCGGIVSESLVQILSAEGINIPSRVVQRGIDSYALHMDVGSVKIATPLKEKRIAAMYRGGGPRGSQGTTWSSFDQFLQDLCVQQGANLIDEKVTDLSFNDGLPVIKTSSGRTGAYDLVAGAVGLQGKSTRLFSDVEFGYQPPEATKTFICEFLMGEEQVRGYFGQSMHVFLLNIPRLQFGALIPKGEFVTLVLLGEEIDKSLVQAFISHPAVVECFPDGWDLVNGFPCQCYPKINIKGAIRPFSDRVVLVGDCAVSKLYKNGIGAAYITAKAAATTAILHGISAQDFTSYYLPACKSLNTDNAIGKWIFGVTHVIQKRKFLKRGVLKMVLKENTKAGKKRVMSTVLWDTFTGSAPYREIFLRTIMPSFWLTFLGKIIVGLIPFKKSTVVHDDEIGSDGLGKIYKDGEVIITQGEVGDCLFVVQSGTVEVLQTANGREIQVARLGEREFFGEMAVFEQRVRSSTVRASGEARVLTVDKKTLLRTIKEDPSLAFRIIQRMSTRLRSMDGTMTRILGTDRRNWMSRPHKYDAPD